MSKPSSAVGPASARSSKAIGAVVLFLVLAVVVGIAVFSHGVSPMIGVPIAIAGALLIDRVLFGSRR
jgi:hypothetical protein